MAKNIYMEAVAAVVLIMAVNQIALVVIPSFFTSIAFFLSSKKERPKLVVATWSHWIRNYFYNISVNVNLRSIRGPKWPNFLKLPQTINSFLHQELEIEIDDF